MNHHLKKYQEVESWMMLKKVINIVVQTLWKKFLIV